MQTKYFSNGMTVAQLKKLYHELAMKWHPDRGGDTATMQAINAQYHDALNGCHGEVTKDAQGESHTYYYNRQREDAVIDFIDRLIKSGALQEDVECWLIGSWVWVQGNTKPVKDILKALGCSWHSKRTAWYWHVPGYRTRYNSAVDLDGLAVAYGASQIMGAHKENADQLS